MMFFKKFIVVFALFSIINPTLANNTPKQNTQPAKTSNHTLIISQDKNGLFTGTLKKAKLKAVLKEVAKHTKLKFFVYPKVEKTYNLSFSSYSEKRLIDTLLKGLNSYRILAKNDKA